MNGTGTALITGGSAGLGRASALALAERGWEVIITGRRVEPLDRVAARAHTITALPGDVTDPRQRERIAVEIAARGRLDLLLNNASALGPSPMPTLARYPEDALAQVFATDVLAPLALIAALIAHVRDAGGTVINISSDAAVEAYAGWGGYGAAKAALDHATAVLAVEEPGLAVYASIPATCAPRCTRRRSPARTSRIGPIRRPWCLRCCICSTRAHPAAGTAPRTSRSQRTQG